MSNGTSGFIAGLLIGALLTTWIFFNISISKTAWNQFRQEAVERGYAEWQLTHAHNGETEFRWLDKSSPPTPETAPPTP